VATTIFLADRRANPTTALLLQTPVQTHSRSLHIACLALLIAALCAGCKKAAAPTPAPTSPAPTAPWPATRKTDRGNFTVTIQPRGGGIATNKHFSLDVRVVPSAEAGAPASVAVDADMPSHGHGMNTKPETFHEGGERYRADGMLFHMEGDWSISVEIATRSAKERALFPVSIE